MFTTCRVTPQRFALPCAYMWASVARCFSPGHPTPHRGQAIKGLDEYIHWHSVSTMVLAGCHLQSWFPLTGLLWKLLDGPCIFPALNNFWWHQFIRSSIGYEFNYKLMPHYYVCLSSKAHLLMYTVTYDLHRPNRLTQCCTQFKSPGVKVLCVLHLH